MRTEKCETLRHREDYSLIFAEIWTTLDPETRNDALTEIDRVMSQDSTADWVVSKLGHIPKFPPDKCAMAREMMEMLTAFRYPIGSEDVPTLAEAMADPWEFLIPIMEGLADEMDQSAID